MSVQYSKLNGLEEVPSDAVELAFQDIVQPSDFESKTKPKRKVKTKSKSATMNATRKIS